MRSRQECGSAYGRIRRGRIPFATAELVGTEGHSAVRGQVDFITTPAGVLVTAELWGLPAGAVLRLCLEREEGGTPFACFPLLYEREGAAWFIDLTEKLSPGLCGARGVRMAATDAREGNESIVARGYIRACNARSG